MKKITLAFGLLLSATFSFSTPVVKQDPPAKNKLKVEVYQGRASSVNAYIFDNGQSIVLLDVLRSSLEAEKLAEHVKAKNLPVTHILISHGHPDHYMGINVMHQAFPNARIVVATPEIKADVKGFSAWMESVGWLDKEQALKPRSDANPAGFDYDNIVEVLPSNSLTLEGGGTLELETNYKPAECEHLTTVYSKDLNALFTSDLCYKGVHLWLGNGVDFDHIANWKDDLQQLKQRYATLKPKVYPGHGEAGDLSLIDATDKYINDFVAVVKSAKTKEEAKARMKALYANHKQADFLLQYSVDYHVK
ncbi:MBL fold metallo-hydrolase [Paraflavisolibacter sp. H34]|uniref:MBL fold metallo-hydrolase n=1 Tax=Huijunlia imazamoxiresistens TaxID=3127457 RepID=UPI00301B5B12